MDKLPLCHGVNRNWTNTEVSLDCKCGIKTLQWKKLRNHLISFLLHSIRQSKSIYRGRALWRKNPTPLKQVYKWVSPSWLLAWDANMSYSHSFGTMILLSRRHVSAWLSCFFSLFKIIQRVWGNLLDTLAWHPDQIRSFHKECNLWSITHSPPHLFPSYFTSAHNSLTESFFDAGTSHDSRKTAPQRRRERKREGQMQAEMETE